MYCEKYLSLQEHSSINNIKKENINSLLYSISYTYENYQENCALIESSGIVLENSNKVLQILTEGFIDTIIKKVKQAIAYLKKLFDKLRVKLKNWVNQRIRSKKPKKDINKDSSIFNITFGKLKSEEVNKGINNFLNAETIIEPNDYINQESIQKFSDELGKVLDYMDYSFQSNDMDTNEEKLNEFSDQINNIKNDSILKIPLDKIFDQERNKKEKIIEECKSKLVLDAVDHLMESYTTWNTEEYFRSLFNVENLIKKLEVDIVPILEKNKETISDSKKSCTKLYKICTETILYIENIKTNMERLLTCRNSYDEEVDKLTNVVYEYTSRHKSDFETK